MANSNPKTTKGRQKIEIKNFIKKSNLAISFSKRRSGIFKKASELSTLCGADVALVVFSPTEKAYSFGHPNVDAVIDRYHMRPPQPNSSSTTTIIDAFQNAKVRGLNTQITQINKEIEAEKNKSDYLDIERKELQKQFWIASSIEDMSPAELDQYKLALEILKSLNESAPSHNPHPHFFVGGSSSSNNPSLHPHFFAGGVASSNNPSLLQQPPCPLPPPQLFPIHPQAPHMLQNLCDVS